MEDKIIDVLRSIGLSRNEVIVYLDLVSFKTSSALSIAKRAKLHRANTYDALKKLIQKGFVTEVLQGEKRLFRALEFDKLKFYVKQKEREIEEIIPLMKSMVGQEQDKKEEVTLSKGIFSFKNFLMNSLGYSKAIEIYGIPSNFIELIGGGFFKDFNKQRIRSKIPIKLIFKQKPEKFDELNQMPFTEARFSGASYISLTIISIFDDEIMMTVPMNPFSIITIKSNDIAESYREYFNVLWKHSKK